jgi:hypothetical protein
VTTNLSPVELVFRPDDAAGPTLPEFSFLLLGLAVILDSALLALRGSRGRALGGEVRRAAFELVRFGARIPTVSECRRLRPRCDVARRMCCHFVG